METHFVVTGIIRYKDRILILKKSPDDYNYPNRWSFCSGFVKEFEPAEKSILREIKEETGLNAKILKTAEPIVVVDKNKRWVVAPFLCESNSDKITLDHENTEYKWIRPEEAKNYNGVPAFLKDLELFSLYSWTKKCQKPLGFLSILRNLGFLTYEQ